MWIYVNSIQETMKDVMFTLPITKEGMKTCTVITKIMVAIMVKVYELINGSTMAHCGANPDFMLCIS